MSSTTSALSLSSNPKSKSNPDRSTFSSSAASASMSHGDSADLLSTILNCAISSSVRSSAIMHGTSWSRSTFDRCAACTRPCPTMMTP
nr:MAG TPA: hypothetical protein [Caudoviricetes sp.]